MNYKITMKKEDFFKVHNRIRARSLSFENENAFFSTDKESIKTLKKTGYQFESENILKKSFFTIAKKYYLLIVGVFMLFSILYINSYRIGDVIFSEDTPINEEIYNRIYRDSKSLFSFDFYTKDVRQLETSIKKEYIDYPYLSISRSNNRLYVDIRKNEENSIPDFTYSGVIIAKKDAVIDSCIVYSGIANTSKNTYVKKGDIIVNDNGSGVAGEIFGFTYYKVNISIAKKYNETSISNEVSDYYNLSFFGNGFDIKNSHPYQNSVKTEKTVFNFFDAFSVKKIVEQEKNVIIKEIKTIDEAILKAKNDYISYFEEKKTNNKERIIDLKEYSYTECLDEYKIVLVVKSLESIGEYSNIV